MIINMNGAKAPETPSSVLQEKTVTPETLPTVIGPDEGYDGLTQVTVNPDAQLKAENIRSGKTIFGVAGTFVGEPQPTAGLDVTALTSMGYSFSNTNPFISSEVLWNNSPNRLTELDVTSLESFSNVNGFVVGYNRGGLVSKENTLNPSIGSSSYIPSVTNYYWYKETGSFEGEITFYIGYNKLNALGWMYADRSPTHIKGSMYVRLGMGMNQYVSELPIPDANQSLHLCTAYGSSIYEIEVDSPLTFEQFAPISSSIALSFKATIPKMEGSVLDYNYSAQKKVGICVIGIPHKMVME